MAEVREMECDNLACRKRVKTEEAVGWLSLATLLPKDLYDRIDLTTLRAGIFCSATCLKYYLTTMPEPRFDRYDTGSGDDFSRSADTQHQYKPTQYL